MSELPLTYEESRTLDRALTEYRNTLQHSRWSDNPQVQSDIAAAEALRERLSLAFFDLESEEPADGH